MTMEIELAKRSFVAELWEETRHDEAARDLIFGEVIEDLEAGVEYQLRISLEDEIKQELKDEWANDPPETIRYALIKEFKDDVPDEIRQVLKDEIREAVAGDYQDKIDDLEAEVASLKECLQSYKTEFANYKKRHPPKE